MGASGAEKPPRRFEETLRYPSRKPRGLTIIQSRSHLNALGLKAGLAYLLGGLVVGADVEAVGLCLVE